METEEQLDHGILLRLDTRVLQELLQPGRLPGSKLASLRGESSNQLFETLEEWNDYIER